MSRGHSAMSSRLMRNLSAADVGWNDPVPAVRFSVSNPPPSLDQSSGKGKKKPRKVKTGAQRPGSLPPMDLSTAERKLEELQRVADLSLLSLDTMSTLSAGPSQVSQLDGEGIPLSSTEMMFLARQQEVPPALTTPKTILPLPSSRESGREQVQSSQSERQLGQVHKVGPNYANGVSSGRNNSALEVVVEALRGRLQNREAELERKDERLRSLQSELDKCKFSHKQELDALLVQHDQALWKLRDVHAKEKAALLSPSHRAVPTDSSHSPVALSLSAAGDSSATVSVSSQLDAQKRLVQQCESLRTELRQRESEWVVERTAMQRDHAQRLHNAEQRLQGEVLGARQLQSQAEDTVASLREQLLQSEREKESLRAQQKAIDDRARAAQRESDRLRAELQNMQQSVAASYRLEASQQPAGQHQTMGLGTGLSQASTASLSSTLTQRLPADLESALRVREAQLEVKQKQLVNKLDFLKNQLESEKKVSDELRAALSERERQRERERDEQDRKDRAMQQRIQQQLAEREQEISAMFESRMCELTTLQRDASSIRLEREDALRDRDASRQQLEALSAQLQRLNMQLQSARAEADSVKAQLTQSEREREEMERKDANKLSQEAVVRRLDSERQYLKNQLAAEIALKSEMQSALNQSQQQLTDTQRQWREDVQTLRDSLTRVQREHAERDSEREGLSLALGAERDSLSIRERELREAATQLRDSLRAEQLRCETLSLERTRLREEVATLREDLQRSSSHLQRQREDAESDKQALRQLMEDAEAAHGRENGRLKDELQRQMVLQSQGALETLRLKEEMGTDRALQRRNVHCQRLLNALGNWQKKSVFHAFLEWKVRSALVNVANQFRGQVQNLLQDHDRESVRQREAALEKLKNQLTAENLAQLRQLELRKEEEMEQKRVEWMLDTEKAVQVEHDAGQALLRQAEEDFSFDLQKLKKDSDGAIQRIIADRDVSLQRARELHEHSLVAERREHERLLEEQLASQREAYEAQSAATAAAHSQELEQERRRLRDNFDVELDYRLSALNKDRDTEQQQLQIAHEKQLQKQLLEIQQAADAMRAEMLLDQEQREQELKQKSWEERNEALRLQREAQREEEESRLRELRQDWATEAKRLQESALEQQQQSFVLQKEAILREKDAEKSKALKVEAGKWRQMLRDADARIDLEANQIRVTEREKLEKDFFENERERLRADFALSLAREKELFAAQVEAKQRDWDREKEKFERSLIERTEKEIQQNQLRLQEQMEKEKSTEIEKERVRMESQLQRVLAVEHERQNALKRDFSVQLAQHATERDGLRDDVRKLERERDVLNSERESERGQMISEFEAERQLLETQREEAVRNERESGQRERDKVRRQLEEDLSAKFQREIVREREQARERSEAALQEMQSESEKLVLQLEQALQRLRDEKQSLSTSLDALTVRLTDTEDALFDLKSDYKSLQTSSSLRAWQMSAKLLTQQQKFQQTLRNWDAEAEARFVQQKSNAQRDWDALIVQYMRAQRVAEDVEAQRSRVVSALTTHRLDDLRAMKKRVAALEGEIERASLEKDAVESQRDALLQDIELYTQEVRESEELARQHQLESSMTVNGRVNVAHARKKKRLDQEIERLLEQIEHKRAQIQDVDMNIIEKTRVREEKESALVDVERELVGVLLEQQRLALREAQELAACTERSKLLASVLRVPWPLPVSEGSLEFVEKLRKQWEEEDNKW